MPAHSIGTIVMVNASGWTLLRKLMAHGGGLAFTADQERLTGAEATGAFEVIGDDGGRNSVVRSLVSGREGLISHGMLRVARPHERPRR
jgi:hypothetical protein